MICLKITMYYTHTDALGRWGYLSNFRLYDGAFAPSELFDSLNPELEDKTFTTGAVTKSMFRDAHGRKPTGCAVSQTALSKH